MSKIEWTDRTWNPVIGCSIVSTGCKNCYAMRDAWRKAHNPRTPHYHGLTEKVNGHPVWTGAVRVIEERFDEPLKWQDPQMVFVNSMGDIFHESIAVRDIAQIFATMALADRHIFQVLTKRADRMADLMPRDGFWSLVESSIERSQYRRNGTLRRRPPHVEAGLEVGVLPNVWLGVSIEDAATARERLPALQATPAIVSMVSLEPMLERPDLEPFIDHIDWLVIGGESGAGARDCNLDDIAFILEQCERNGTRAFVKQLGKVWADRMRQAGKPTHQKGGELDDWPADLRVRQYPRALDSLGLQPAF